MLAEAGRTWRIMGTRAHRRPFCNAFRRGLLTRADIAPARRQATFAPSQTSATDIALALLVFFVAFGGGLFFNSR